MGVEDFELRLSVDQENDVAYLQLGEDRPSVRQRFVALPKSELVIDLDVDGRVIGFEFLSASKLLGLP